MSRRLEGRRCIVTGGGTGIGRAVALRFADEGARVVVSGRRPERLEQVTAEHEAIALYAADVADPAAARGLVEFAVERYGGLDVLFHAGGVLRRNEVLAETSDDEWASDLGVNLTGAFNIVRPAIPHLVTSRGTIILVASQLSHIGAAGYASYCAAKGGVLGLMRALALDLGPSGVRVNALSPGVVDTDMAYVGRDFGAIRDTVANAIPLRRVGLPEDMTGPAVFLASDDAAWMTGHSLVVDGGYTVQ